MKHIERNAISVTRLLEFRQMKVELQTLSTQKKAAEKRERAQTKQLETQHLKAFRADRQCSMEKQKFEDLVLVNILSSNIFI